MKKYFIIVLFALLLFHSCTIIKDTSVKADKFLDIEDFPNDIYSTSPKGIIYSPFDIKIEHAEKIILFDFKGHNRYKFLECQFYSDSIFGKGIVCMLMRHDDRLEIYHTEGLNMKQQLYYFDSTQYSIPTQTFNPSCTFEYENGSLKFSLGFTDRYGNKISANLSGNYPDYYNFIVPVGLINRHKTNYVYFPLWYMRKINFLNTNEGKANITINDTTLVIKKIPGLINWKRVYFARWSFDPIFILWNKNATRTIKGYSGKEVENDSISYKIDKTNGYAEIEKVIFKESKHTCSLHFSPSLPELLCLKEDVHLQGRFTVDVDEKQGVIGGEYTIDRTTNTVEITLQPTKGWQPVPGKSWIKNHYLTLQITPTGEDEVVIKSKWRIH